MIRCQLEITGSKNPTVSLADADLDLAAKLVAIAGFGLTGRACTATSRVIVGTSGLAAFTEEARGVGGPGRSARGFRLASRWGLPSTARTRRQPGRHHAGHLPRAPSSSGAVPDHRGDLAHGWFLQPAVLGGVTPSMRVAQEEIFGPVVALAVDGFDEERSPWPTARGLRPSASLVTRDYRKARRMPTASSAAS